MSRYTPTTFGEHFTIVDPIRHTRTLAVIVTPHDNPRFVRCATAPMGEVVDVHRVTFGCDIEPGFNEEWPA